MMRLRGGYPYTQNPPGCLKRLSKKDLKESIRSEEEGEAQVQTLNELQRTNLLREILQVSRGWRGRLYGSGSRARTLRGLQGLVCGGGGVGGCLGSQRGHHQGPAEHHKIKGCARMNFTR